MKEVAHEGVARLSGPMNSSEPRSSRYRQPQRKYLSKSGYASPGEYALVAAMEAGEWCHSPHKDIVAAPYLSKEPSDLKPIEGPFDHLLVHAGGIWGAHGQGPRTVSYYSMGVRQQLFLKYGNGMTPGMVILNYSIGSSRFRQLMARSAFCLAPCGDGCARISARPAHDEQFCATCLPFYAPLPVFFVPITSLNQLIERSSPVFVRQVGHSLQQDCGGEFVRAASHPTAG